MKRLLAYEVSGREQKWCDPDFYRKWSGKVDSELIPVRNLFFLPGQMEYARDLGNKLFVYISYCFAGRAYPRGDINDSPDNVRNQVFQCLCSQHTVNANEDEDIYPYLR